MTLEDNYVFKQDMMRKQILSLPKNEREPVRRQFKQLNEEFRKICYHRFVAQCVDTNTRYICEKCGHYNFNSHKELNNRSVISINVDQFKQLMRTFDKFR